jgi:hypothetical protein
MVVVSVNSDGGSYPWFLLTPNDVHVDDVVDLGAETTYTTMKQPYGGQNSTSEWRVTHVTLEGQGYYRLGFLPEKGWWGGQIDLHFHYTDRLRVMR